MTRVLRRIRNDTVTENAVLGDARAQRGCSESCDGRRTAQSCEPSMPNVSQAAAPCS